MFVGQFLNCVPVITHYLSLMWKTIDHIEYIHHFYPWPVLAFRYCRCLCVCVCVHVSVRQSPACPHSNSSAVGNSMILAILAIPEKKISNIWKNCHLQNSPKHKNNIPGNPLIIQGQKYVNWTIFTIQTDWKLNIKTAPCQYIPYQHLFPHGKHPQHIGQMNGPSLCTKLWKMEDAYIFIYFPKHLSTYIDKLG